MTVEDVERILGRELTRDERIHLEVLGEFRSTDGIEGCDLIVRSGAQRSRDARAWAREFGWCTTCRLRTARTGRVTCSVCAESNAAYQRSEAGKVIHRRATKRWKAKRAARNAGREPQAPVNGEMESRR